MKTLDKDLSKIQTFVLDALAPLTAILETDSDRLSPAQLQAATYAVQLLGNAHAHISRLRREMVIAGVNKSLLRLVKEDPPTSMLLLTCLGQTSPNDQRSSWSRLRPFAPPCRQRAILQSTKAGLSFGGANPREGQGPTNEVEPETSSGVVETDKPETRTNNRYSIVSINCYQNKMFNNYPPVNSKKHGDQPSGFINKPSWKAGRFCLQLEQINQGPVDPGQNRVSLYALPEVQATPHQIPQGTTSPYRTGS